MLQAGLRTAFEHPIRALTVLLAAWTLSSGGCALFGDRPVPPEVSLVDLVPLPSEGFEQRFEVTLRVVNPNEQAIVAEGFDAVLELNGRRLARALSDERFVVPRLGDTRLTIVATTNLVDLFRQALRLPGAARLDYMLRGRILLADARGWVSFEREGTLLPE